MWSKKENHDAFVITITPRTISHYHVSRPTPNAPIQLNSHNTHTLDRLEVEKVILFNPTSIGNQIGHWYRTTINRPIPVLISINGPSIFSKVIPTSNAHPSFEQLNLPRTPHMKWAHHYLYSHEHRHYFYVCGIPQYILLQFKLVAITEQLPLFMISSEYMALIDLYRHLLGTTFSNSALGMALSAHHNRIEQLFSKDDINQIVSLGTSQAVANEQYISLLTACGLFISKGWQ